MSFIIGEDVRVAGARDSVLLGLRGKVVLETMHTLTIRAGENRKIVLPKIGTALRLADGTILLGDDLEGRLEDRIGATGRVARKRGRRSR